MDEKKWMKLYAKKMLNNIMVTSLATQFIWKITESDYTLMALSSFFVFFSNKVANYKRILIMIIIKLSFPYSDDNKFSIPQHQKPQQKQQAKLNIEQKKCSAENEKKWEPEKVMGLCNWCKHTMKWIFYFVLQSFCTPDK